MAEVNPPYVLHNVGATHTAEGFRMMISALTGGFRTSGSLGARGGIRGDLGGGMLVTASGSPSLVLNIASGIALIPGSEGTRQGLYVCVNDATDTVTMAAAHGSLPRIDLVVARVQDSFYSGATDSWSLEAVTGTAAGSPVAPSAPANSLILATINRTAADDTIASGDIVDSRPIMVAAGGVHQVASTGKTALLTRVGNGAVSVETDTGKIQSVVGGAWVGVTDITQQIFTSSGTWTKPTGAHRVLIRVIGGGGAGGGAAATGASQLSVGGGGGAGAYAESLMTAASLGATVTVTVGAAGAAASGTTGGTGGDSSFGTHVVAGGGAGGGTMAAGATALAVDGGSGGTPTAGNLQISGSDGDNGIRFSGVDGQQYSGSGGDGFFGGGPRGVRTSVVGIAGDIGCGGSGASNSSSAGAKAGGAGGPGRVIVTTFF